MFIKNYVCLCVKMFMGYFGNNLYICFIVKKLNYYLKENILLFRIVILL